MSIKCAGPAELRIPETGEIVEVNPDDLEWEFVEAYDRPMGAELYYSARFCFSSEKEDFEVQVEWDVYEYPMGTIEHVNVNCDGCELLEDFDIYSDSLEDDYDPYEDLYEDQLNAILSNTEFYHTFSDEISSLRVLNSLTLNNDKAQIILKRQIFISAVTCLETYLSDAFINTVLSDQNHIKSFFSTFKHFKSKQIKMSELFSYFEKAEEIAKKEMLEVTYHNLPKVSNMYKSTLDITFPDFSKIQRYIATRHDLVHRNGITKKGKQIILDENVVDEFICMLKNFVNELDRELKDREKSE
ncbi:MAG: HEPN domain-containing protein [Microcoleaceae cyanobacterium]